MREMWRTLSFPFLFGRAFIEAPAETSHHQSRGPFPFLFGRAFIEAPVRWASKITTDVFPFLFGRAFIEASTMRSTGSSRSWISLPFRKGFH